MKFAIANGFRSEASPQGRAVCPYCGKEMVAKCGSMIVWHWAHVARRSCDPWWENETEWHRAWKNLFPQTWQEVIHRDDRNGERHIADVKTPFDLVLEFQHSSMTESEKDARDSFYGKIVWVVDATHWKKRLWLGAPLPSPEAVISREVLFAPPSFFGKPRSGETEEHFSLRVNYRIGTVFSRGNIEISPLIPSKGNDRQYDLYNRGMTVKSRNDRGDIEVISAPAVPIAASTSSASQECATDISIAVSTTVQTAIWNLFIKAGGVQETKQTTEELNAAYEGHHFYSSERDIAIWEMSKPPVFFDVGDPNNILRLMEYGSRTFHCLRWMSKAEFMRRIQLNHLL
jgi:hypothetical protein